MQSTGDFHDSYVHIVINTAKGPFKNDFPIVMYNWLKFNSALIQIVVKWSL